MAKASKPAPTKPVYRSAIDGEFVTKKYAEKHPNTTVKEKVPIPKPQPKKNK